MIDNDGSSADRLGQIADEFVASFRQGMRPSVEEFARRYPEHADDIREMLPALALMEQAKSGDDRPGEGTKAAAPAAAPPLRQLGDYQILREVGRGGMGVVYEAQQLSLGRHVAIKVLPARALLDARDLARFQREARSAAKLHHTNIVPVFGVGEQDGLHYYVMQFIPGLGLDVVLHELRRLRQPRGTQAPTQDEPPGHSTNVARDCSPVDVARGLLTGGTRRPERPCDFTVASDAPAAERDEGRGMRDEGTQQDASDSSLVPHPSSLSSSATIRLPGQSEGSTLSESGHQYWQSVARVGVQVADALAYAASQGILHRDIKPSNLLLDDTGNVWVTDFGLAKATGDGDNLTHTGDIVGTLRYMAPERFNGQGDVRSDVYSLGLTLYEMLALRPAFDEKDRSKLVKQVMHDEPVRPRKVNPRVPRDLETVVLKAIARDLAHRYQTPAELAEDLKRFVEDRPVKARRVSEAERLWRWRRRNPLAAGLLAGIVLVFLAGFAGVVWQWRVAETQTVVALDREQEARQEAEKAQKARDFLVSIFQKAERDEKGGSVTVRQLLEEAETRIPVEFADQPKLREDLVSAIAKVKRGIGRQTPQAMILQVRGSVRLQSAAGVPKAAVPQTLLNLDDQLALTADAQVQLVFLSNFHKEQLKAGREVTIDHEACEPADAVLERDDSILMTFVQLPKATFYMGWNGTQGSAKKTEIKEDFEIAVHDVTQGQWQAIMGTNPTFFSRKGNGRNSILGISDEELKLFPVENVSWEDAQAFLKKLNEKERGRGYLYRLPSEAEWEYACRGGATSEEECSHDFYLDKPADDLSSEQANFNGNFPVGVALEGPYLGRPTRVGAYPANKLGLCDMHGNVWQWTDSARGSDRVSRGGGWDYHGPNCRTAVFRKYAPTVRSSDIGLRLVRVPVRPE
jgi:serine/threonine protein kinase/formylglycine-generating enzyme required for sulfatase activity